MWVELAADETVATETGLPAPSGRKSVSDAMRPSRGRPAWSWLGCCRLGVWALTPLSMDNKPVRFSHRGPHSCRRQAACIS